MDFTFNIEGIGIELPLLEVRVYDYSPSRPAPFASNPDSSYFADPGDDEYYEYEIFMVVGLGKTKKYIQMSDEFSEWILDYISEEITKQAKEAWE